MDRDSIRYALIALLGVLAVALGAATLPETEQTDSETSAGDTGTGDGGGGLSDVHASDTPADSIDIPLAYTSEIFQILGLLALIGFLFFVYTNYRESLGSVLGALVVVLVMLYAVQFFSFFEKPPETTQFGFGNMEFLGEEGTPGEAAPSNPTTIPLELIIVLLLLTGVIALAVVRFRNTTVSASKSEVPEEDTVTDETTAMGRAAGRAADRLEDESSSENEIYRAWVEMTTLLDISRPETKTPGEFADTAIDTGMDREDVQKLTGLFEQVRYGEREPTDTDEKRAIEIFRRIESTYAGDET